MKVIRVVFIGILVFFSAVSVAGLVQPADVIITLETDGSGSAQGDMVTARFADNDVEFIGCGIRLFDFGSGVFEFGFCQAEDSSETSAFCSTQNADLLESMRATADFSFVTFSFDTAGECTRIGFSTQSFYIPELAQEHTHTYLTGKGNGHNNTEAQSGPMMPE